MTKRIGLAVVCVIGLVAGSTAGVAAQDVAADEAAAAAAAVFDASVDSSDPEFPRVQADDARAAGSLTIGPGEAFVDEELVLAPFSARLTNDDGTWAGTARALAGGDGRHLTLFELQGEGGYDGLTLLLVSSDPEGVIYWGMIVPTDRIMPYPESPSA